MRSFKLTLSNLENRMLRRIVGYLEYGKALESLEHLASICSESELKAIDDIILEREEFTIYPASFSSLENTRKPEFELVSPNGERSLAWVIALARIEFGAIIAGFTEEPNPLGFINRDTIAHAETMRLLIESANTHYHAMKYDRHLQVFTDRRAKVKEENPEAAIKNGLGLGRRLRMARSLLRPAITELSNANSDSRYGSKPQLEAMIQELDRAQYAVNDRIRDYFRTYTSYEVESGFAEEFTRACTALLNAEQQELRAGTAKITSAPQGAQRGK